MSEKIRTTTTATLTVNIPTGIYYQDSESIETAVNQSKKDAINKLNKAVQGTGITITSIPVISLISSIEE